MLVKDDKASALEEEMASLFAYVQRVRQEVASLYVGGRDGDHTVPTMAEQLAVIVEATEDATHKIMEAAEKTSQSLDALRDEFGPAGAQHMNDISMSIVDIFQACTFQDVTGQRVTKVLKSLSFVEEHVERLAAVWGTDELSNTTLSQPEKTEDEKLLEGPQMEGQGVSQAEIDALFD